MIQHHTERCVVFDCEGSRMLGILHSPRNGSEVVFVFVVGGPQYRVGSHRMFVELARTFAHSGFHVLRFDCRGMGDSDGDFQGFEHISTDIRCAIDIAVTETGAHSVSLFGLCDGASACAMYVSQDPRVDRMVLVNPWVRTEATEAKARVKSYYRSRALQLEFWRRLLSGKVRVADSLRGLAQSLRGSRGSSPPPPFVDQMRLGLESFGGHVDFVASGNDLVAQEFVDLVRGSAEWTSTIGRPTMRILVAEGADHTFSGDGQLAGLVVRLLGLQT